MIVKLIRNGTEFAILSVSYALLSMLFEQQLRVSPADIVQYILFGLISLPVIHLVNSKATTALRAKRKMG